MTTVNEALLVRLQDLEAEVASLKRKMQGKPRKKAEKSLLGVWRDIDISDAEIEAVKASWSATLDK
ncbi:MAG TPA: hypothetical protein VH951_09190 [Dehalococcoidia bacterium]|jgi:hypothetical protein